MASREVQVRIKVDKEQIDAAMESMRRSMGRFTKALAAHAVPVWRPWSWYRTSERGE